MEDFEWNVYNESQLLDAMVGHKPVGVNKYFQMAFICDKFMDNINKEVESEKIWSHLETMYNLEALDESESLPFPNDEREFCLPEAEFGSLKALKEEKSDDKKTNTAKGRETPKNMKETKKEDKLLNRSIKEVQRRDSKESKEGKIMQREENKTPRGKSEEAIKAIKRPTRGSLKPEDNSNGKASPLTVTPTGNKRRRI